MFSLIRFARIGGGTKMIGKAKAFLQALSLIARIAKCEVPVLIEGEPHRQGIGGARHPLWQRPTRIPVCSLELRRHPSVIENDCSATSAAYTGGRAEPGRSRSIRATRYAIPG